MGWIRFRCTTQSFLNQALASLWPTLSAIPSMKSEAIVAQLQDIKDDTEFLKAEIRQKIGEEAHPGQCAQVQPVDKAEQLIQGVRLSKIGCLAWELAQLGRNKRRRLDPDPTGSPIHYALDALNNTSTMLCTLAARVAVLEARIAKTPARLYQRIGILQSQLGAVRFQFVGVIQQFLRDCNRDDSDNPATVGAHAQLRTRFAVLSQSQNEIKRLEDALPIAVKIVDTIDSCFLDQNRDATDKPT